MPVSKFGSKAVVKALKQWERDVVDDIKRIIVETCEIIQAEARVRAPSDSGYLKKSIEIEYLDGGLTGVINVGADYAIYVEYGTGIYAEKGNGRKDGWTYYSEELGRFVFTKGMKAQPFWFDALDIGRKYFRKEMRKLGR